MLTENLKAQERFQEDANHADTLESCASDENFLNDDVISVEAFNISSLGCKH